MTELMEFETDFERCLPIIKKRFITCKILINVAKRFQLRYIYKVLSINILFAYYIFIA